MNNKLVKGKSMSNLAEEFNIEEVKKEIKTFKNIISEIKEIPNPDIIITATIEKASIFLDLVHSEIENGEISPRYMEVASQLINTIIQSSGFLHSSIQTDFENRLKRISSKQKDREIDIKEREVEIKEIYFNKKQIGGDSDTNKVKTDYNSILKFLENKDKNED